MDEPPNPLQPPPDPSSTESPVDLEALTAWILAGATLFPAGTLPRIDTVLTAARRVVLETALKHHNGNITHIAAALGTSRRVVRYHLRAVGLYQPPIT